MMKGYLKAFAYGLRHFEARIGVSQTNLQFKFSLYLHYNKSKNMTTASALLEVFKTLPPKSKKEFVYLLTEENEKTNLFMQSLERGLKEVRAIESGEKKGKTLKEILNGN
jgi:hypothetical protein